MTKLAIAEPATDDLRAIWLYIAENSYTDYADGQLDNILTECELIAHQPGMGVEKPEVAKGIRCFPAGRYNIYYRYYEETIWVVHVVDSARDLRNIDF